jgi:peptidoglycan/xylan/chitin deacetylase (PgdA/CDA1 family)
VTITGLQPSTTYQYKIVAASSRGQKSGTLVKFTTQATTPPPTANKTVYLTFDDGPTAGYTTQVLAYLNAAGAHATFFEIGQSMYTDSGMCPGTASYATCLANAGNSSYGNYGLMKQIVADGNQVGTHTWDHPSLKTVTSAQATAEISQARSLQAAVTGRDSKLFRFPYNIGTASANQYLASQGMQSIGADVDPSDWSWQTLSDNAVTSYVMSHVTDGAVVQLHDGQDVLGRDNGSPGYLPGLLAQLKDAGYKFGTLTLGGPYPSNIIKVGPAGRA